MHTRTAGLLPILDTTFGIAICVGSTVGVGILRTPGEVAALLPASAWIAAAWLLGGLYVLLCANYVAELATLVPNVGGPYVYARRAFGELAGFIVGFSDWLLITSSLAFLAVALGEYLGALLPSLTHRESAVAVTVLVLFALVNLLGLRAGSATQKLSSGLKAAALVVFVVACFAAPGSTSQPAAASTAISFSSAALAMQLIIGTYGGWNTPIYFAEEDRNPRRNLPRSLFFGALLVIALYVLVNLALLHVLPIAQLGTSKLPAADALMRTFGDAAGRIVTVLAIVLLLSIINAGVLSTPRVLIGMSRDRLFFSRAAHVSPRGVPDAALAATIAVAILFAATGSFVSLLAHYAVVAVVINICAVLSFFRLRRIEPARERPFRARGYPFAPLLAMTIDIALLISFLVSQTRSTLYTLLMLALGWPLYVVWRKIAIRFTQSASTR